MSEAEAGKTKSSLKKLLVSVKNKKAGSAHDDGVVREKDGSESVGKVDADHTPSGQSSRTAATSPPQSVKETNDIKPESAKGGKSAGAARGSNDPSEPAAHSGDHHGRLSMLVRKSKILQTGGNSEASSRQTPPLALRKSNSLKAGKSASHAEEPGHKDVARDAIKPLATQLDHRAASHGKMIESSSRALNPQIAPQSDNQSASAELFQLNPILLIGLTLFGCIILALIVYLVVKYRRRPKRMNAEKCHGSNSKGSKNRPPLSNFISNGKLFGANKKPNLMKRASELRHKKAADCDQLTINMDGDCCSNQSSIISEDSDGAQSRNFMKRQKRSNNKSPAELRYKLSYDFNQSLLSVSILEARNLPGMDLNGYSDPYVKVYLSPNQSLPAAGTPPAAAAAAPPLKGDNQQTRDGDSVCYRTRIHKRTLNPVFNETFRFHLDYAELTNKTLIMSMYDYDRLSKHDVMGQVSVAMKQIDLAQGQDEWAELRKTNEQLGERLGDICLSLRYVPSSGKLNVVVLQARQLKKMDVAGLSDPYVKLALMSNQGKRLKKKKTSIKKFTLNPHYNESFSFEIPFEQIQQVQLVVSVVDYDRIGTSEPIGKITLGCEQPEGSTELRHWMDMLASPRRPIAQWHTLKDINLDGRTSSGSTASSGSASKLPTDSRI